MNVSTLSKKTPTQVKELSRPTPKYDLYYVQAELNDMLEQLRAHPEIESKAHLFESREYSYAKFNQWKAKYEANTRVHDRIKKIEEIIESRLVQRGLAGKAIPMTIFLLKNYYNYTDQYQQKVDTTVTFKVVRGNRGEQPIIVPNTTQVIDQSPTAPTHTTTKHTNKTSKNTKTTHKK